MDVSIIIVNFNTTSHLKKCLDSILEHFKDNIEYEIIVVDNNSPQRDIEQLPLIYPSVSFYLRNVNDGFGAGCNFGAKKSNGKYLLLVNPDVIFLDDVAYKFYSYMQGHQDTAICSGLLMDENKNLCSSYDYFLNLKLVVRRAFNIGDKRSFKKRMERKEIVQNQPFKIDWAIGALLCIRSDIYNIVNGFNEKIFLYWEDEEIQYRIKKLGYHIVCLPYVRVYHYYGSSVDSEYKDDLSNFHFAQSRMIYMDLHFNFFKRLLSRILFSLSILLRIIYLPFNKNFKKSHNKRFNQLYKMFLIYLKLYHV